MSDILVVEVFDSVCDFTTRALFSVDATTRDRVVVFLHNQMMCMAYEHRTSDAGYSDEVLGRLGNIPWDGLDFAFSVIDLPLSACGKVERLI